MTTEPAESEPRKWQPRHADEPTALLLIYVGGMVYAVYGTGRLVSLMTEPDPPVLASDAASPFIRDGNRWVRRAPGQ